MRNLKKVLSLALAMVMLIGMMVVGAGAANFTDAADIKNTEAVAVVSGIEVLLGVDDGSSFNPAGVLTRAEAAMVIARLDLGPTAAAALKANGTNNFSDVPSSHWAIGAIDYCVEQGYILGDGAGHFMPTETVTGVQFALMLARLLGYDSKAENVTGSSWAAAAAALARRAGLTTGVAANTAEMTRDDMAQMTFNALKADMVEYTDGTGMIIDLGNGASITAGAKASKVMHKADEALYTGGKAKDDNSNSVKLCETKFPDLKLDSDDKDAFGRPASTWSYDKTTVFTKANAADVTITEKTGEDALKKLLPKGAALENNSVTPKYFGGGSGAVTTLAKVAELTGSGKMVELYVNDDDKITDIFVTTYTVEKVKAVTEKNDKTTYTFTVTAGSYVNDEDNTNCVVAGAVEKGDVVTTVKTDANTIHVYPTESFTGNQTAKKTTSSGVTTLTIGGEQYVLGTGVNKVAAPEKFGNSDKDATYYVDQHGFIVMAEDVEVQSAEYAMIVDAAGSKTGASLDNNTSYNADVRAVLADGTVQDFTLELKESAEDNDLFDGAKANFLYAGKVSLDNCHVSGYSIQDKLNSIVAGKVWGYTLNDDGEMVLEGTTEPNSLTADTPARVTNSTAYTSGNTTSNGKVTALFNSNTVFVLYNVDGKKVTAEAPITGVANLKVDTIKAGDMQAIVTGTNTRGTASVVFLEGAVAGEKYYVYVNHKENNLVGKDYVYTGTLPDGTTEEVTKNSRLTSSGLYEYDVDTLKLGDKVEGVTASGNAERGKVYKDVTAVTDGNMLKVGDSWIELTDTPVTSVVDGVDSEIVNGCTLLIVMDSESASKITGIYVTKASVDAAVTIAGDAEITEGVTADNKVALTANFSAGTSGLTAKSYNWEKGADDDNVTVTAGTGENANKADVVIADNKSGTATVTVTVTLSDDSTVRATKTITTKGTEGATITPTVANGTISTAFAAGTDSTLTVSEWSFGSSNANVVVTATSNGGATVAAADTAVAGDYTATVTVTATLSNGATINGTVSVTVTKA